MFRRLPPSALSGIAGLLSWMTVAGGPLRAQQVPDTLRYSFFAPDTLSQKYEKQGYAVAVSGDTAAVGSPLYDRDPVSAPDCGVVKIYDTGNGNLLHRLDSPSGEPFGCFGLSVAISGSRVVVGSGEAAGAETRAGMVHVYDLASANPSVPVLSLPNPEPAADDQFGQSVAIDGDIVAAGAWMDDTGAPDSGRVYVYDLGGPSPQEPVAALENPSPAENDCFGVSVAVAASRVAVAAYHDNTGNPNAGRVYLYDLENPVPGAPVMSFGKPEAQPNDCFGSALAMAGSLMVVGCELSDGEALNSGQAFVFDLDSATPSQPLLVLSNPAPQDHGYFGNSVSVSGNTVAVGAYGNDTAGQNGGACYIFDRAAADPAVPALVLSRPAWDADDYFGNSVAISGGTVVAGAWYDDSGDEDSGITHVYDLEGEFPETPVLSLDSPLRDSTDRFGSAVAIAEDLVAVGSPDSDSGATRAGRLSVHDLSSSKPSTPLALLENPYPALNDAFGAAVAVSGKRVAAGAPGADAGAPNAGRLYVYDFSAGPPESPSVELLNPSPGAGDGFGAAAVFSGDLLAVGAAMDDDEAEDSGRVFVFDLSSATPGVPVAVIGNPSPAEGDRFGCALALSGTRLAVGAMNDDTGAENAGCAYLYDLATPGPGVPVLVIPNPDPAAEDGFGGAVGLEGDLLAIGASGDDTGASNAGSVHAYELGGANPAVPVLVLPNPAPAEEDRFGHAVAVSGSRIAVGAYLDNSPADSGRVRVYDTGSLSPEVPVAVLAKSTPANGDRFGTSVAIAGLIVAVGAPSDDKTAADKGAAYIYGPAAPEIAVEGPTGEELVSGAPVDFGAVAIGPGGGMLSFTILNTGITGLPLSGITLSGGDAGDFAVDTSGMPAVVPADDDTAFTVALNATQPGIRTTTLLIGNGDVTEDPFRIVLSGTALSPAEDTDGDGLNDLAELRMAPLGFDWQNPDAPLVAAFLGNTAAAGFFEAGQVRALRLARPGLEKETPGGNLKLSWSLETSEDFTNYVPFPMSPPAVSVNPAGELEFRFSGAGDAAFYRLETK